MFAVQAKPSTGDKLQDIEEFAKALVSTRNDEPGQTDPAAAAAAAIGGELLSILKGRGRRELNL
ncbi:MAG: hypothetical protein ACHP7K_03230 [Actinomycetales bacterium]